MKGFIYNNQSTEDIIGVPLILCSLDGDVSSVSTSDRNDNTGSQTITRQTPNEYGVINSLAQFTYGLIKSDGTNFTDDEQRTLERWLTSPKFSKELYLFDCKDSGVVGDTTISDFYYSGKFLSTEWVIANGYFAMSFTFQCNTAYPFKKYSYSYDITEETKVEIDCESDDLEEYVYPTVQFTQNIVSELQSDFNFELENTTDDANTMRAIVQSGKTLVLDCKHCIPFDYTLTTETKTNFSYTDLGWNDVGNIYWLRLIPGKNNLVINCNGQVTVTFNCPYKKAGGWL